MKLLLVLALVSCGGCVLSRDGVHTRMLKPRSMICADGLPIKLLLGAECPNGLCGYTCQHDRWKEN